MKGATGREMFAKELVGATWGKAIRRSDRACTGATDSTSNLGLGFLFADGTKIRYM